MTDYEKVRAAAESLHKAAVSKSVSEAKWKHNSSVAWEPPDINEDVISEDLHWVIEWYQKYKTPEPSDFDSMVNDLGVVAGDFGVLKEKLGTEALEQIDTAKNELDDWSGEFRNNLVRNYLTPFPQITANHGRVAYYLARRASDMRQIYNSRNEKAVEIAEKAEASIDSITVNSQASDVLPWLFAGMIAAGTAMGGVGALMSTTVASASTAMAAPIIVGATLGGPGIPEEPEGASVKIESETEEEMPLDGDNTKQVLDNVREALKALDEEVDKAEVKLMTDLTKTWGFLGEKVAGTVEKGNPLVPIKPEMVGAPAAEFMNGKLQTPGMETSPPASNESSEGSDDDSGEGSYHGPKERPPDFRGSWDQDEELSDGDNSGG